MAVSQEAAQTFLQQLNALPADQMAGRLAELMNSNALTCATSAKPAAGASPDTTTDRLKAIEDQMTKLMDSLKNTPKSPPDPKTDTNDLMMNMPIEAEEDAQRDVEKVTKEPLVEKRDFIKLPEFSGKLGDYHDFRFALRGFFDRDLWLKALLDSVESAVVKPGNEDTEIADLQLDIQEPMKNTAIVIKPDLWNTSDHAVVRLLRLLSKSVYQCLRTLLKGSAATMLQNIEHVGSVRGLEAWGRLHRESLGENGPRVLGLCDAVFFPARVKLEDVCAAAENYEGVVRQLEKCDETKLSPLMKMWGLMRLLPEELASDFTKHSSSFGRSFESAKRWAFNQVVLRKKGAWSEVARKSLHQFEHSHEEELQCEDCVPALWNDLPEDDKKSLMAFMRSGSGQKGGGGPRFQGTCDFCGIYGHRQSECRKKTAYLQGKGGGKAAPPFNSVNQKGENKGFGKDAPKGGFGKGPMGQGGGYSDFRSKGNAKGGFKGNAQGLPLQQLTNLVQAMEQGAGGYQGGQWNSHGAGGYHGGQWNSWGPPGLMQLTTKTQSTTPVSSTSDDPKHEESKEEEFPGLLQLPTQAQSVTAVSNMFDGLEDEESDEEESDTPSGLPAVSPTAVTKGEAAKQTEIV